MVEIVRQRTITKTAIITNNGYLSRNSKNNNTIIMISIRTMRNSNGNNDKKLPDSLKGLVPQPGLLRKGQGCR